MPPLEKEIEEFNRTVGEFRTRFDAFEKGVFTKADFKTFEEKITPRIAALETVITRPPADVRAAGEEKAKEGAAEYKHAFFNWMRSGELKLDQKAAAYVTARKLEVKALVEDVTG